MSLTNAIRSIIRKRKHSLPSFFLFFLFFLFLIHTIRYIIHETSFNDSYQKGSSIYRVLLKDQMNGNVYGITPFFFAKTLQDTYSQIANSTNIFKDEVQLISGGQHNSISNTAFVSRGFVDLFDIKENSIEGNCDLTRNSALISRNLANSIFTNTEMVGKSIEILHKGTKSLIVVCGVFEDFPANSTIQTDLILSADLVEDSLKNNVYRDLSECIVETYIYTNKSKDVKVIEKGLKPYLSKYFNTENGFTLEFQNLTKVYLHSGDIKNNISTSGSKFLIWLYISITVALFLITVINFQFLIIARIASEIRYIGIRRVLGASNGDIIFNQFLESLLIILASLVVSIFFTPILDTILLKLSVNKSYLNTTTSLTLISLLSIISVLIALVSSFTISVFLSSLNPAQALYRNVLIGSRGRHSKQVLLIVQVIIFIVCISFSAIIDKQLRFAMNIDQGYNTENLLILYGENWESKSYQRFRSEMLKEPGIESISGALCIPPSESQGIQYLPKPGSPDEYVPVEVLYVDSTFVQTLELFTLVSKSDDCVLHNSKEVVISESVVTLLELNNPLNQYITIASEKYNIIGVVKDFFIHSIHQEANPTIIVYNPEFIKDYAIRIHPAYAGIILNTLKNRISDYFPEQRIDFGFSEYFIQNQYSSERKVLNIVLIITIVTVMSASFGLFAFSRLEINTRRKEISLRKMYGASSRSIVRMHILEYLKLFIISALFAGPITYQIIRLWSTRFYYQSEEHILVYTVTLLLSMILVLLSVIINSIKLSKRDILECLKQN